MKMFFLVTGASGAGKSTVRKLIEPDLAAKLVACELGSLGITPEWTLRWRHQAVEQAVQLAVKAQQIRPAFPPLRRSCSAGRTVRRAQRQQAPRDRSLSPRCIAAETNRPPHLAW